MSGSRDTTIRVWDIENGECIRILYGHVAAVRCVQFDGVRIVSGAYDYSVKVSRYCVNCGVVISMVLVARNGENIKFSLA